MNIEQQHAILDKTYKDLTKFCGKPPRGNVAPWWEASQEGAELMLKYGGTYFSEPIFPILTPDLSRKTCLHSLCLRVIPMTCPGAHIQAVKSNADFEICAVEYGDFAPFQRCSRRSTPR